MSSTNGRNRSEVARAFAGVVDRSWLKAVLAAPDPDLPEISRPAAPSGHVAVSTCCPGASRRRAKLSGTVCAGAAPGVDTEITCSVSPQRLRTR